tara:strand:- start:73 stop:246 length:174 start_codon:yes stop_codon:yes gene_type:complete
MLFTTTMVEKTMKKGDLIYNSYDDEIAIYIQDGYDGWICVHLNGEKCQVQKCWWRKL